MTQLRKRVVPVFCDVKPSDLRLKDDSSCSSEDLRKFRTALEEAKYTVGLTFDTVRGYGPCQTPTLCFCVQRHLDIPLLSINFLGIASLHYNTKVMISNYKIWERHSRIFDSDIALMLQNIVKEDVMLKVIGISEKQESKGRHAGLNTVKLLKVASSSLGFGPELAMQMVERLYIQGYKTVSFYLENRLNFSVQPLLKIAF